MKKDYPRESCKACSIEKECTSLRKEWQCYRCKDTLLCGATHQLGRNNCPFVKNLWDEQTPHCRFIRGIIQQQNLEPADLLIHRGHDWFVCPRCEQPCLYLVQHTTSPSEASYHDDSVFVTSAQCRFCRLDEVHKA